MQDISSDVILEKSGSGHRTLFIKFVFGPREWAEVTRGMGLLPDEDEGFLIIAKKEMEDLVREFIEEEQ